MLWRATEVFACFLIGVMISFLSGAPVWGCFLGGMIFTTWVNTAILRDDVRAVRETVSKESIRRALERE